MELDDLARIRDTLTVSIEKAKAELNEVEEARRKIELYLEQLHDARVRAVSAMRDLRQETMRERVKARGWNESIASQVREAAIDFLQDGTPRTLQEIHQHTSEGGVDVDATYLRRILLREVEKGDIIRQKDRRFLIHPPPEQEEQ